MRFFSALLLICSALLHAGDAAVTEPANKIPGALVIHGGGETPAAVLDAFVELAGKDKASVVIIPTAAEDADKLDKDKAAEFLTKRGITQVSVLQTTSREQADKDEFAAPLRTATAVWLGGGQQKTLAAIYGGTLVEKELHALLARGGVIGGTSAGAAIMSRVMIGGGDADRPVISQGFGLLPSGIVDQHFLARKRMPRLIAALKEHPGLFGLGIDEGTAIVVRGRNIRVLGTSSVTVCLSASQDRPLRTYELKAGQDVDLVGLSRAAIARAQPPFPPVKMDDPVVIKNGTLFIVGGGGMPPEATTRFITACGGPDALIVVIPSALSEEPPRRLGEMALLLQAGAKNLKVVHARNPTEAADEKVLSVLREAKGIWFCGGRQWRLVDSFGGTEAEKLMHDVLARGGAIGGSSAGATIQGEYLVRGNPLGNFEMMWEGYERGFGFLKGVAVDQHFTQRNRFKDMTLLKQAFPQVLGMGIDESTAAVVTGSTLEVVGEHNIAIYAQEKTAPGQQDYEVLKPGEKYDLKTKQRMK